MGRMLIDLVRDDRGTVTVDWVVLCGALIAVATGIFILMEDGTESASGRVSGWIVDSVPSGNIGGTDLNVTKNSNLENN